MFKSKIFLFSCLYLHQVASLQCYTSNTSFANFSTENVVHKLQDCKDYIVNFSSTETPIGVVLHCFTIKADYLETVIKGCLPENNCKSMTKVFQQFVIQNNPSVSNDVIENVECMECPNNGCNSDNFLFKKKIKRPKTKNQKEKKHNSGCDFRFSVPLSIYFALFSLLWKTP